MDIFFAPKCVHYANKRDGTIKIAATATWLLHHGDEWNIHHCIYRLPVQIEDKEQQNNLLFEAGKNTLEGN